MRIGIPKEIHRGEKRVATTPDTAERLQKLGFSVALESGAGLNANFSDAAYREAGAEIIEDTRSLWSTSDIILKVRSPSIHPELGIDEVELLQEGGYLISFIWPAQNKELLERLAAKKNTVLAMDSVPRISRAQKLDPLSSMANIAGYRAVIEASHHFGRFFAGQITAAGKIPPAKILVIGAGVAGLSAIGTAAGLGAIVRAFDTRPEVKEQVQSMGAEFLELKFAEESAGEGGYAKEMTPEFIQAEMDLFTQQAREVDIILTTALIPGKKAPELITEEMVKSMKEGSVIVDLAAEQGGNCALTTPDEVVVKHGVTIIGYTDLPSRLSTQSSQLYATNLRHLLEELCPEKDGTIHLNMEDEVIRGLTVIKEGEITWPPPPPRISATPASQPAKPQPAPAPAEVKEKSKLSKEWRIAMIMALGGLGLWGLGTVAPPSFMTHFTVFVLACFVGYQVIWNVTPSLHTPLMSVTNAISSIIVIGALIQVSKSGILIALLAGIAILITSINIAGGFLVTQRMLRMFRK
ncbi:Re/Si-specific NAD(P)(+) transhydrogenase subunit alpha [Nitrosococcus oceani]|uniref:NAD(P) transhydrogenase subunit alpha n=2 Tax=Nitrosococcus oceani TaxID=1229 RepID=Q3JEF4_NITOC|nr:Re/Si-specific NAD(P)(+) transhydrogenase subunit alpha [Nitrosococcus oceani]KFI20745.1 NAD(P) transhydrogenase subunit alpha [Nitrosococcus oceani C-27]ABA56792.1 NAD(P) transhydrogenase, alpha subunit [Nitrosococcus oceani ATCC 19707]EDZ65617.1 NAD(P) transhydrogenase, alpha subunit [Nitrosococcus oceani AFC27]KFI23816.1 NAD(P) transhydrogenase subunit alpha [Nitrosococcus oceani]GEM20548.1 NAD(P) transhydrogenase subunit alpha [Nitrosococcus oceani]